jgi:hypothetical protein
MADFCCFIKSLKYKPRTDSGIDVRGATVFEAGGLGEVLVEA